MDLKEMSVSVEASTTTASVLKATTVIASTISREYLKVLELREYCKIIESDLKECESRVQTLISSKSESSKIKAEYKKRNKINITNSESLLQAKNELYKYKCELKSSYIAAEKALKCKKLKFNKIISSYESGWQKALKEFNANPVFVKFQEVQEENVRLEMKVEEQEKLNSCTEKQFLELKQHIRWTFFKKIVEFSELMIKYREFSDLQKRNKEMASLELRKNSSRNLEFRLFNKEQPFIGKSSSGSESNEDVNCSSSIDVSIFDDVMVPSENLESQHLEEDIFFTPQSKEQSNESSKDQENDLESLNKTKHSEHKKNQKIIKSLNDVDANSVPIGGKGTTADENESQYFRPQATEFSVQAKIVEVNSENIKSISGASEVPMQNLRENEEGVHRKRQMEFEESLSDGSSENQFCSQREIYDGQYQKISSISSDEYPPPAENTNEGPESPEKPQEENETHLFKSSEPEKTDLKSFAGFFTMGNDYDSPKPSIFKLF